MMCRSWKCPDCEDRLIHLVNRGPNESSSPLGQHVHDHLPNQFYWMDADGIIYKKATKIWRFIEHKFAGQTLSNSQVDMLPKLATMIASAAVYNQVQRDESGCFVMWTDTEFTSAVVQRVLPGRDLEFGTAIQLSADKLERFLSGEFVGKAKKVHHKFGVVIADNEAA